MRHATARAGLAGLSAALLLGTSVFAIAQDDPIPAGMVSEEEADFTATLTGDAQVPPVETTGSGEAWVAWDEATMTLSWTIEFSGLSGPVIAAHFHGPAAEGENAGPVVDICANVTTDLSMDMAPAEGAEGEAAAQAEAVAGADAGADMDLDGDGVLESPEAEAGGIDDAPAMDSMETYGCAAPDQNAEGEAEEQRDIAEGAATQYLVGKATLTADEAAQLADGLWYVNLHTDTYPDGEIRGQVTASGGM
ncbi:MAG: CHRD domain-containing protein [Bauldia sp.]|nr:CHRD domain-containing protein [Bauldia sp.]